MISRYNKILCLVLVSLLLIGCWDYRDIDDRSIVHSVGIDNEDDKIQFTGEVTAQRERSSQNRGISQQGDVYRYTSSGNYFEGARAELDAKTPFERFTAAIRAIVFSKKYAEEKGIESYIYRVYFLSAYRNSVLVSISKEPTSDLFRRRIENNISIGHGIEDTIRYLDADGAALYKTTQQIKSDIEFKTIGYLLPYITMEEDTVIYLGFAAMKDSKLVGIIKRQESNGFLFVLSKKPITISAIPLPSSEKNLISIRTVLEKRSIKTSYADDKVNIYIDLKLNSQLQYEYDNIEPLSKEDSKKVENIVSNKIKEDVMYAIKRSQKEFKSDVFGFARYFRKDNPKAYKKIDWKEEYTKANIHVNVETTIKNTNLLNPNAKNKVKEG